MSPRLPEGEPAPRGALPDRVLAALGTRPLGVYVHVPSRAGRWAALVRDLELGRPCMHNLGYWRSHDWWAGPGHGARARRVTGARTALRWISSEQLAA
jgi:hypothetical protein